LNSLDVRPGGSYIDATAGGGGHSLAILERTEKTGRLLAVDADPSAVARTTKRLAPFGSSAVVAQGNFADLLTIARSHGFPMVAGILFDLGVSSYQLDEADRGFSFQRSGPLDMRFDSNQPLSAYDVVNTWPERELAQIIRRYGEETRANRIARSVVAHRPLYSTDQLAAIVEGAVRSVRKHIHPATKTFQALRMAVNNEMANLERGLNHAIELLEPGGRLVVISFQSLEDRMVKTTLVREAANCICPPKTPVCICGHKARLKLVARRAQTPSKKEQSANPRSRSARLRVAEKIAD
jgi:16S rRNA (cytosine1402-N4)-methyltransferase